MRRFILLLQFLTRIPINIDLGFDEEFHKTIVYYPLVGLVIGVLLYIVGFLALKIFDPFIASIIITLASVILTGGLHIDGLGDTFDAIYSNRDKERMLEIMKDSRLGTNSLLAIMFLILMKVGLINNLINSNLLWAVIFMPMVARLEVLVMMYKTISPRKNGMGNLFIGKATKRMCITATTYTSLFIILICKFGFSISNEWIVNIFFTMIVLFLFVKNFKRSVYKKIDGVTGDILGCTIELSELVFLLVFYIIGNYNLLFI